MKTTIALALLCTLAACQTTTRSVVEADATTRQPLLDAMKSLEGRWEGKAANGMDAVHEIRVTSNGHVVRELMFPGDPHEMTNMYALDGNSLLMTHYCGGGNQPRMRATSIDGNRIAFRCDGVTDLKAADEIYMGEMTLVMVDDDTIEEHWQAFSGDEVDHEMVFTLHRAN